jgi:head-tail adaptor
MLKAGSLDRRLTLRRRQAGAKSGFGTPSTVWADLASDIACRRTPLLDAERTRAAQVGATVTDRFVIRWARAWADVNPKDQLVCEGVSFNIVAVKELGRREGLEITATAAADI